MSLQGSALLVSVLVFNVAQALVRNRSEATIFTVIATVSAALLASERTERMASSHCS